MCQNQKQKSEQNNWKNLKFGPKETTCKDRTKGVIAAEGIITIAKKQSTETRCLEGILEIIKTPLISKYESINLSSEKSFPGLPAL